MEVALFVLLGTNLFLTTIMLFKKGRTGEGASEGFVEDRIEELKSGIMADLGQTRAAVEFGMRDSGEAYDAAREQLAGQIDVAVERMREELFDANEHALANVHTAVEHVFASAKHSIDEALVGQATLLRDLKGNYERAIADLRAAVAQSSARQTEAIGQISGRSGATPSSGLDNRSIEILRSVQTQLASFGQRISELQGSVDSNRAILAEVFPDHVLPDSATPPMSQAG